ncbi:MAG: DeoR/GlpR transcriptional regulator [Clostridia bacterium]|nr:DeoR/GlpR transcriptional regulator [Clostridia bacterium]
MLAQERYKYITEQLEAKNSISVNDIAAALSVSIETVRRDLILLETHGKLKRVFGGAVAVENTQHFSSFESRLDQNTDLKAELSRYAVSMIDNGDTVAIESGSTAVEMAKVLLKSDLDITIITHSNTVFNILKDKFRIVLIGGEYYKEDDCFGGVLAEDFLRRFHVNKSFVFPSAVSFENGIESYLLQTMPIHRALTEISDRVFVCADSEKIGSRAMFKSLELDPEFIYITDSKASDDIKRQFAERGLVLISEEQKC